jgi:hypothetical protein
MLVTQPQRYDYPFRHHRHLTHVDVQNFVRKLKQHLLPRILAVLAQERLSSPDPQDIRSHESQAPPADISSDHNLIFFKSDRIYEHRLLRINYTTYDVRRSQDVINFGNSRQDIMTLADEDDARSDPPFSYARVLGIYHVNVIYTGPGMVDYSSRRLDFLWVRWFHHVQQHKWEDCKLDSVAFLPMADENAFGFLDPGNVLRASHIVPTFLQGYIHADTIAISLCARDSHDWKQYYVNRYVLEILCPPRQSHV